MSSKGKCQWCGRQTDHIEKLNLCKDQICDRCVIKNSKTKSKCPVCWEKEISSFLIFNRTCSVCCTKIQGASLNCDRKHVFCSGCNSGGCYLCLFLRLQASNDKFDGVSSQLKKAFYHCSQWQLQAEANPSQFNSPRSQSSKSKTEETKVAEEEDETCIICRDDLSEGPCRKLEHCGHRFHEMCIDSWFESSGKQSCPTCGYVYGISKGPQPANGKMIVKYIPVIIPGFEHQHYKDKRETAIEIIYVFPNGIQGPLNPKPGKPFSGTTRKAYLPNTKEGQEILKLLRKAFDDQHVFTVGKSVTSGQEDVVTWNDIHHKTSIQGGSQHFGYPDPTYLMRVRQELADKGYK